MVSNREETLAQLIEFDPVEVPTPFPWWTNGMSHISQVPAEERFVTDLRASGRSRALHAEQNVDFLMKGVIQKFTLPGKTVMYPCAATFAASKAFMFLLRHRCFVGYEIDTVCFKESLLACGQVLSRQIVVEESTGVGEVDLQAITKVLGSVINSIGARQKKLLCFSRTWCVLHSLFQSLLRTFSSTASGIPHFMRWERHFRYHNCQKMAREFLYNECGHLMSLDNGRAGLTLKKSLIGHRAVALDIFARRSFDQGMVSGN